MKNWLQMVLLVVAGAAAVAQAPLCPDTCWCDSFHTIGCIAVPLSQPPPGYWPQVAYLYLQRNSISRLFGYSLTGFPNIVTLDLTANELVELDLQVFSATPSLLYLYLADNRIHTVTWVSTGPQFVHNNLRHISLENNDITVLDPDLFADIAPNLYQLHLSHNPLSVDVGQPVINHPQLQWLYLDGVKRLHAGAGSFSGLLHVQRLFLANSDIAEVTAGAFASADLRVLSLSSNPLERFDASALASVMTGGSIDFHDTPLACSCNYAGLFWWAFGRVTLLAECATGNACSFTRQDAP